MSLEGATGAGVGPGGLVWVTAMGGVREGTVGVEDGKGGRGMSTRPPLDLVSVGKGGRGISGRIGANLTEVKNTKLRMEATHTHTHT